MRITTIEELESSGAHDDPNMMARFLFLHTVGSRMCLLRPRLGCDKIDPVLVGNLAPLSLVPISFPDLTAGSLDVPFNSYYKMASSIVTNGSNDVEVYYYPDDYSYNEGIIDLMLLVQEASISAPKPPRIRPRDAVQVDWVGDD